MRIFHDNVIQIWMYTFFYKNNPIPINFAKSFKHLCYIFAYNQFSILCITCAFTARCETKNNRNIKYKLITSTHNVPKNVFATQSL